MMHTVTPTCTYMILHIVIDIIIYSASRKRVARVVAYK